MKLIETGSSKSITISPDPWHTAAAIGNTGVDAISTPSILGFLEQASLALIKDCIESGELSVGHFVELHHIHPAFVGAVLECNATLEKIDGRRLNFLIEAKQGANVIAHGRYVRVVVDAEHFSKPVAKGTVSPLRFYFDFHSPWSYLASLRLPAIAMRYGRSIEWIPIHLARLIERIGGRNVLSENDAFVRWYKADMQDWADMQGVKVRYHSSFPLRTAMALRAAEFVAQQGDASHFVRRVMHRYWSDNADISDIHELRRIAEECGLDSDAIAAASADETIKRKVLENTELAVREGVFGAPSVIADGKLFFGNDRLELLSNFLKAKILSFDGNQPKVTL